MRRRDNITAAAAVAEDEDEDDDCDGCNGGGAERWAVVRTPRQKPIFHQVSDVHSLFTYTEFRPMFHSVS